MGVNAWHGIAERDGMYQKGDVVTVTARELKSREYNGKTYYNVDADSIVPDDLVQRLGFLPSRLPAAGRLFPAGAGFRGSIPARTECLD